MMGGGIRGRVTNVTEKLLNGRKLKSDSREKCGELAGPPHLRCVLRARWHMCGMRTLRVTCYLLYCILGARRSMLNRVLELEQ